MTDIRSTLVFFAAAAVLVSGTVFTLASLLPLA